MRTVEEEGPITYATITYIVNRSNDAKISVEHSSSTIASFVVLEGGVDPQNMGYIIGNSLVFNVQRPSFQVTT